MGFRFLTVFLFFCNIYVFAQTLEVNNEALSYAGKYMSFYVDSTRKAKIETIISLDSNQFTRSNSDFPKFGVSKSALWIRINVLNHTGKRCYVKFINTRLGTVTLYSQQNASDRNYKTNTAGYNIPVKTRDFFTPTILFELPYADDNLTHTYFFRITSKEGLSAAAQIGSVEKVVNSILINSVLDALYFGILAVMILYNLFLFISIRSKSYIFYLLFLLSMGFYLLFVKGYTIYLPDGIKNTIYDYNVILVVFIEAFAALFAITFLDIRNLSQKLFYYLIFLVVSNIPIVIIELMGLLGTNSLLQNMQVILSALSLLCIVVYAIIKKRPGAWIYLISWFSLLTSIVIYIFMIMGLLPDSPYVSHIIPIGSTLETILLSLALADRINSLGKEKQLILKKSLEDSNNYNEELAQREEELASNEEELRVANDALSSANEYLENFLAQEKMLNEQLTINEEELTSKEEELRQSLEELSTINEELVHVNELTRKRERQVSAIFDNTTDIIVSIDIDFKITIANKRFKEIFEKFTNEDYQSGIYVLDVIPNDKKHFYLNTYRKVLSGEYIFQVTDNYEDGLERYISEEFYSPIRDLDGEISGVAIFIRDITKRIDTEERIKKQELLFSAIINSTNNFVLSLDENLKLLAFNKNYEQRASKVFNRKIESGKISAFELLPPQFHEIYNDIFQKVFKGESVVKIFHRPKVIDGLDEIFSEEFFNPILNENGEVKGIAIFVSDITARVVAEKKLNENQKLLSMGQKMAKLGSWVLILKTGEIKFSDQMFEIYEYPKSKVITIGVFLEIVGPDVYERNRQMFEYTIKEKKPFSIEYKYIAPSGKVKYIFGMGNPILNEEGELIEILGIGQDITEIREAEEKLRFQTEELIESNMKTSEYKLMALRSVMNPHFLFNSLNSIQYFIIKNDREQALNYLSTFSKLIRSILNSSIENSYTLSEEIDLLKLYISLETLRFDQKFKTVFKVDKNLELENIEIPTLILQPYVENAILHGLYNKLGDTEGKLMIEFKKKGDSLVCIVEDNGVGREEAKKIREASRLHKSVGMMVTQERLDLINKNNNLSVKITDLVDKEGAPCGTRVEITVLIYN